MNRKNQPHGAISLQNKAQAYRILADCYHPPAEMLRSDLQTLHEILNGESMELGAMVKTMLDDIEAGMDIDTLTVDYSRLFVGPFSLLAPPYGSVYLENGKRVMGETTELVRGYFANEGLGLAEDFREAPDHIAAELEFLHYLYVKELRALWAGDPEAGNGYGNLRQEFLQKHLGRWIGSFSESVINGAETGFYRELASLTEKMVSMEMGSQLH